MHEEGVFVQFTYGLGSPVPRVDDRFLPSGFVGQASPPVWLNFPPARVWTYRGRHHDGTLGPEPRPDLIDKLKNGKEKLGDEWERRASACDESFWSAPQRPRRNSAPVPRRSGPV